MMKLLHPLKQDSIGILNQIQLLEDHMVVLDWTITRNGLKVLMEMDILNTNTNARKTHVSL